MVDIAKTGGHQCIVHTAASSQLGQMLVRLCKVEGLELINIVRKKEQVDILKGIGAEHVLNSTDADFRKQFSKLARATGASIAFDAVGAEITTSLMLGMPPG